MIRSWMLWIVGAIALTGLVLTMGWDGPDILSPPANSTESSAESASKASGPEDPPDSTQTDGVEADGPKGTEGAASTSRPSESQAQQPALRVNGEPIAKSALDRAFRNLLGRYKDRYAQRGDSLQEALQGPSGAYLELQIRYQAAQSLIETTLITQEAQERGLSVDSETLQSAVTQRYENFLDKNGMSEDQLRNMLDNPEKRKIVQRLLGMDEPSVEAFKRRLRREERQRLLRARLVRDLVGSDVEPDSEQANQALEDWLQQAKSDSTIRYMNPLLRAYHRERQLTEMEDLEAKLAQLERAIAAYEKARQQTDSPHIDYFLGQLHNLRVNWSSAVRDRLANSGSASEGTAQTNALEADIGESREKATQLLSPFQIQNEQQLRKMMQADPANPLYKFMYAQFLVQSDRPQGQPMAIRMLERALELNDRYVDAYVLYGDIRLDQGNAQAAVRRYRQALQAHGPDVRPQFRNTEIDTIRHKLAQAQIAYARKLSSQDAPDVDNASAKRAEALAQAKSLLGELRSRLDPQSETTARVLADLGEVAMLEQRYADAQKRFRASLQVQESPKVRVRLGDAYRKAEQWKQAEAAYQQALTQRAHFAPAHQGLAKLYQAQDKNENAESQYEQAFLHGTDLSYSERRQIALEALEMNPDDVSMRLHLGQFYLDRNVYEGAMEEFQAVLQRQSDSVEARLGVGRVQFERSHYSRALATFRQALEVATTPSERIQVYEWIVEAEQRVVGPGNPLSERGQEALWQLAQLYAETGQYTQSFQTLLDLRETYPDFRPQKVQQHIEEVKNAGAGDTRPGRSTPDQGASIIEPGEDHTPYATTPPTSGPHYRIPADWGIHAEPIPEEVGLRNLAGGGVIIYHQPGLEESTHKQLRKLVRSFRSQEATCRVILAPYEDLDAPITLAAWRRLATLDSFEEEVIRQFVEAFVGTGPEVGQVGCRTSGSS